MFRILVVEDNEQQIVTKLKCNYRKRLRKAAKQFHCDFYTDDYYCNNACIPILTKAHADIYLKFDVELTKDGCLQTVQIDRSAFSKDEAEAEEKGEQNP